jgi:hypothetical protein
LSLNDILAHLGYAEAARAIFGHDADRSGAIELAEFVAYERAARGLGEGERAGGTAKELTGARSSAKAAKRAAREAREAVRRVAHEQRMEEEAAEDLKRIDEKRQDKEQPQEKKVKKKRRAVQYVPTGSADF